MGKAKPPGSKSRSGEKSRSKRGRQTLNRSEDRKIAQANSSPDDLLKERSQRSAGGRKSKSSSQGPQQSNDSDPVSCDQFESELLTPKETAQFLKMSESWLAKARMNGNGPPYAKPSRSVRYPKAGVIAWLKKKTMTSTSQ